MHACHVVLTDVSLIKMDPCGSFYASAAQGMPSLSSLPPSFHERPFLYPPGYSQQNPRIIDNGAGKLDEILSLLKKQQEEITDLKKEVIIQRLVLRVSFG